MIAALALLTGTACAQTTRVETRTVVQREAAAERAGTLDVTLKNGMRVIVRRHGDAGDDAGGVPGRTAFWLRVEAGSAHEREDERGAAHVGEHLALSGLEPGQPGFADAARLRVPIGKDRNGYTNVDHAAYWIVTDGTAEQNDAAMRTLASVLQPQMPSPETFDREREIVIQEWNETDSPETRAQRTLLSGLFPGTAMDTRWPSVEPEVLARLTPESVHRFRSRTGSPARATLVVVGPGEPGETAAVAGEVFGKLAGPITLGEEREGEPDDARGGRRGGERGLRTVRAPTEGLTQTEITIAWPGRTSVDSLTAEGLADSIAVAVMRDRVNRLIAQTPDWAGSDLIVFDSPLPVPAGEGGAERLRLTQIGGTFPPGAASRGLSTLALAVAGIELNPLTEAEVASGIEAVESRYERAAEREGGRSVSEIASMLAMRLPGRVMPTAAERLATVKRLLPEIRTATVTEAARSLFDPKRAVLLAQGPPGKLPSSSSMMADLRLALFAAPGADGLPAIGAVGEEPTLFREPPTAAEVRRVSLDERSGVFDAVLSNGVTVRHREMPTTDGEVYLRVLIGEGALPEESWELAQAAARMLAERPATLASPDEQLVRMMERRGMELDGRTVEGSIDLLLRAPADSLDRGASLLAALLTEPSVSGLDLDRYRSRETAEFEETREVPARLAREVLEARLNEAGRKLGESRPATAELDPAAFKQRLSEYSATGVREALIKAAQRGRVVVTVVGACSRDEAVEAVAGAFGALRRGATPRAERWTTTVPDETETRVVTTEPGESAACAAAWSVPRELTVREVRGLVVATNILDERLATVDGLDAFFRGYQRVTIAFDPADPGWASVVVMFNSPPGEIDSVRAKAESVLRDFAARGPTAEELEKARARGVSISERALGSAWFWSSRLATSELGDQPLEALLTMPTDYAAVNAEACRVLIAEALAGGRVSVIASPAER